MADFTGIRNGWHDADGNARGPDEPFGPPQAARPACAGKGFEHHQQVTVPEDGGRWSCPDCGDTGSYADFEAYSKRLASLIPLLYRLKEQMLDRRAVIMVPTEAASGSLGTFYGLDVLRVPGLAEPMIGISALVPGLTGRHEALKSFAAEMEQEHGPVTEAELQAVREEWKP